MLFPDPKPEQHVLGAAGPVHDARASRLRLLRRDAEDEPADARGHHEARTVDDRTPGRRPGDTQRQEDV